MCGVCGCGDPDQPAVEHEHVGPDGKVVRHAHGGGGEDHHHDEHEHEGEHAHEHAHAHEHEHEHVGPDGKVFRHVHRHEHHGHDHHQARVVQIQRDILGKNDELARVNRARFAAAGTFVVNLMSSPGSGKTTLLTRTLRELAGKVEMAVIEGDQQTSLDADRIRATGVPAVQINTGKGCHLDAAMVGRALEKQPPPRGILFIENVGNLVCPAGFDLGEHRRAVVVSVTEGEDKPLKYPDMFATADVVLVNKADLLPHLAFDVAALEANVRRLRPNVPILRVSATTGEGMDAWLAWLREGAAGQVR
jgi:hydrogenase nickel incorporation protein HypB